MKFDKDQLLKHHFWILVGLSVPFALVAILLLVTSVSGNIATLRSGLLKTLGLGKQSTHRPEEVKEKQIEADFLVKKETEAWKKAFLEQESLLRWPRKIEATYHFADGLFANDVHVIKLPAEKTDWPADKPGELIHGMLIAADESKFEIVDKDGKNRYTFFATPKVQQRDGVTDDRGEKKGLSFASLAQLNPKETALAVSYQKTRYFNDRLTYGERRDYAKAYLSQIPPILRMVDPVRIEKDEDGKPRLTGVVQLRSSGWTFEATDRDYDEIPDKVKDKLIPPEDSKFLRFLGKEWNTEKTDISDEAWIAQEDLWIQTEIYRLIRAANDSLSSFTEVARDNNTKTVTYKNPYLAITMQLKNANTLELHIANQLNRRQKIETMKVRARFVDPKVKAESEVFAIVTKTNDADPLQPKGDRKDGDKRTITVALKQGPRRDGIFGLEQVLTWETAAVKRIEQIAIGMSDDVAQSQKNMSISLRALIEKKPEEAPAASKDGGMPQGGSNVGPKTGTGVGLGAPPGAFGAGGAATALDHGFTAERYQEVTPQFRRLPVAVVLIVDQNQVDRVLTAFNNSRLRFLMSQVLLNHYTKSVKPDMPADKADDGSPSGGVPPGPGPGPGPGPARPMGGSAFPGAGKSPMGGSAFPGAGKSPGGSFFPGGGIGPMGPGGYGAPAVTATDELEANMELVIYGVVTLYERYPPRAAQGTTASPTAEAPKTP
jgi:hypothetical protein